MSSKHLGPYEILGVLGRGGMGTVFRGRHETTGDVVAIKALSHASADETHFRQRFESEIQALLKLNHPNIVRILSFGQERGTLFFAMELVEGTSLFHLQRKVKKFDWREVLKIARDVASALKHAHDRGIIHRDLKPGNLMRSEPDGVIKVTDFGIAKSFGSDNDTKDNVIGTLDFMSPEQASGRPVTVRSDLYSLGAVLYTLLTGAPPFASNSIEESLINLTRVPAPPVRDRVPHVPEELDMLIGELLEKKPEDRTATAYALLKKLDYVEQVLRDHSEAKTAHNRQGNSSASSGDTTGRGGSSPNISPPSPRSTSGNSASSAPRAPEVRSPGPRKPNPANNDPFLLGEPGSESNPNPQSTDAVTRSPGDPAKSASKSPSPARTSNRAAAATRASRETVATPSPAANSADYELEAPPPRHDYFNTVTDQQRRTYAVGETPPAPPTRLGWFPMFLALVALSAVGAYFTWQALQPPTASQLFALIESKATEPLAVHDEMVQFLKLYPDDERAGSVRELLEMEQAIAYYKRLAVRVNLPGENRLTQLEQKYVTVMNEVQNDPVVGFSALESLVALHDAGAETPEPDQLVVTSAKAMLTKVRQDIQQKSEWNREQISAALRRAADQPEQAVKILNAIVEMYGKNPTYQDLVQQAQEQLSQVGQ